VVHFTLDGRRSGGAEYSFALRGGVPTVLLSCRNLIKDLVEVLLYLALSLGLVHRSIVSTGSFLYFLFRVLVVVVES
jgi:hypothetical protein